ncbi:MAG: thioesterase [Alphaproteobacteria bacterium]|nr:thioesterase [Alphaproteobacteria bacterium]
MAQTVFDAKPIEITGQSVLPEWIDYNGHMNVAFYVLAFDKALDKVFDLLDIGEEYVQRTGDSAFVLQNHVTYLNELKLNDPIRVTFQQLDWDAKKVHYFVHMYHASEGFLAATAEQVMMHVSLETRRSSPFPPEAQAKLAAMQAAHMKLPRPESAGASIGIRRKSAA